jgi:3-keto-5-aminohexanoate cleavage enzyme
MSSDRVIIDVCMNGEVQPSTNPHVPRTPAEVAADARRCLDAGASILHSHADDPNIPDADGTGAVHDPEPYREAWAPLRRERPDIVWYPTMAGGGPGTTIQQRASHLEALAEDDLLKLAIVDMGTTNMGKIEEDGLPTRSDALFVNTNGDAHYMFELCTRHRVGPSVGVIEPGSLRVALAFWRAGRMPEGAIIRMMFGSSSALAGLPPTAAALDVCLETFDEMDLPWEVATMGGGDPIDNGLARAALERGGHVRLGIEDYGAMQPSRTNAEMVERAVKLAAEVGREPASPSAAAEILGLPRRSFSGAKAETSST